MNRRNFLGNILLTGASFFVLPAARLERRIWVPDRHIITETAGSIWRDYYMSRHFENWKLPRQKPIHGNLIKHGGEIWYACATEDFWNKPVTDWFLLRKLSEPLKWMDHRSPEPDAKVYPLPLNCGPIQEINLYYTQHGVGLRQDPAFSVRDGLTKAWKKLDGTISNPKGVAVMDWPSEHYIK